MADIIRTWRNSDAAREESKMVLSEVDDDVQDVDEENSQELKQFLQHMDEQRLFFISQFAKDPGKDTLRITEKERLKNEYPLAVKYLLKMVEQRNKNPVSKVKKQNLIIQEALELGKLVKEQEGIIYEFVRTQENKVNQRYKPKGKKHSQESGEVEVKVKGTLQTMKIINPLVYKATSLLGKESGVDGGRMWWYDGTTLQPPQELFEYFKTDYETLVMERIQDLKVNAKGYFVVIRWLGFIKRDDPWERMETFAHDVSNLVREFLLDT
eukprot:augustus_masked-scaffold_2-processed-gene-12.10-mRNA-1 protein AED:1.00 eAED:1.00 QI:0/0/0/0/1/1/3/0/267